MDPISVVCTAVALGASAGLKETATAAVKDAYAGLKALLTDRRIDVAGVERRPGSDSKLESLREDLLDLGETPDAVDERLTDAAWRLIAAVKDHDPGAAADFGIDLEEFSAGSLRITGLRSAGGGVRGRSWQIAGDAVFEDIRAGGPRSRRAAPGETPRGGDRDPRKR